MEPIEQIRRAVENNRDDYRVRRTRNRPYRSNSRMWDDIIRLLCAGCGRPFQAFNGRNREIYCYRCKRILYPEDLSDIYRPHSRY